MGQQSAPPLQLHSNSFASGSGQEPQLRAAVGGGGGGGGAGRGSRRRRPRSPSSSAHQRDLPLRRRRCHFQVEPRWIAGAATRAAGRPWSQGQADVKPGSCSPVTICRPGVMFPWMNPRTADLKQSGNILFFFFLIIFGLKKSNIKTRKGTHVDDIISTPGVCGALAETLTSSLGSLLLQQHHHR